MKKIFLGIVATLLFSTAAVYADNGKKAAKKNAVYDLSHNKIL